MNMDWFFKKRFKDKPLLIVASYILIVVSSFLLFSGAERIIVQKIKPNIVAAPYVTPPSIIVVPGTPQQIPGSSPVTTVVLGPGPTTVTTPPVTSPPQTIPPTIPPPPTNPPTTPFFPVPLPSIPPVTVPPLCIPGLVGC